MSKTIRTKPPRKNLGKRVKEEAKSRRKTLKEESNPKVLKKKASDIWNFC